MTMDKAPEDAAADVRPARMSFEKFRFKATQARALRLRSGQAWTPVPTWSLLILTLLLTSCAHKPAPDTLVMIIESSPTNLDPRVGVDAWSENIDGLLFDNLVSRDEHLSVKPALAERWCCRRYYRRILFWAPA